MVNQIVVNDLSSTPKYVQIVNSIIEGIECNLIVPGQKLPSLYELCAELEVSKRTVEKAYLQLKEKEIIGGVHGKGFYINHSKLGRSQKVLLLFNKMSAHKKIVYDAFADRLGSDVSIDLYIYNNDSRLFRDQLSKHRHGYSHYVIIPHFFDDHQAATALLNQLPKDKLILLDKHVEGIGGYYASVVQNFRKDLIQALTEALPLLRKYSTLNILFPSHTYQPRDILDGFYSFCYEHQFTANVVSDVEKLTIRPTNAYINLMEEDLVTLIKKIKDTNYRVGEQVGILSYNETPLKEILLDGITVMSTDFALMGQTAADLVSNNQSRHVEIPFRLIARKSL